jgi:hypothetical protein
MKIGAVVDVEKGVIQVKNGPKVFSFLAFECQKKIVFDAHSRFSFVSVVFSSLTITSKKFADEENPSHSFSNTYLQHAPCSNKKITLNCNSLFDAPYHTWSILASSKQV